MIRRISLIMDHELFEDLTAAAWVKVWGMLPPDTKQIGMTSMAHSTDSVELRLTSQAFDEHTLGATSPVFELTAYRPTGIPIDQAQLTIQAIFSSMTPPWVQQYPSKAPAYARPPIPDLRLDTDSPYAGECICDFAYTGLRYHKGNCPCKK